MVAAPGFLVALLYWITVPTLAREDRAGLKTLIEDAEHTREITCSSTAISS